MSSARRRVRGPPPPNRRDEVPLDDDVARDLLARGDLEGAVAACDRLIDAGTEPEARLTRGALLASLGRLDPARADLEAAAAADPPNPWPLQRLADMLSASGRPYAAADALSRALDGAPWLQEVRVNAGRGFLALEHLDRAYAAVRALPAELPGWWRSQRDGIVALFRPHHLHARNLLRELRGDLCGQPRAFELALTLFKVGRLRLAEHMAEALGARDPADVEPLLLLARVRARRDGCAAAAAVLLAAQDRFTGDARFDRALVRFLHDAGDTAAVLALLGPEPRADDDEHALLVRAMGLATLGRRDELRQLCRAWIALEPQSVAAAGFVASGELAETAPRDAEGPDAGGAVLAQFWDRTEVPDDVAAVMRSWREQHPGLEVRLFDTDSAREHLRAAFGGAVAGVFDLCRHAAMKADLFRLGWLLSEGGVWADADERCIRPLGPLLAWAAQQDLVAPLSGEVPGYVHNFFLGARAGSRAVEAAFEAACAAVDAQARAGRRPDIWATTGPGLITRVAAARLLSWTSGGEASGVRLISAQQYACFVRTEHDLAYKRDSAANWHTA